ncbi:hypothetical protein [Flavobacterium flavigenum]|uniref:hypothetical protein n=1 Tax=Flavobacterium flavigenum TaxID=3003258 RepID=UPI0022ABD14A|nr:hypothetical protein [Flavobacterium flavigenum]
MKILNKVFTVFFILFSVLSAFAAPSPAPPPAPGPPVLGAPIDGIGLLMLAFAAISLGIYVIYKHKLKTKASV